MTDLPQVLAALRAIANGLELHAGAEAPRSPAAIICHALCCSLRSAADELEQIGQTNDVSAAP